MYLKINEVDRAHEKLQEANEKSCEIFNSSWKLLPIINLSISIYYSIWREATQPNTNSLLALGAILQTKSESEAAMNVYKKIRNIQEEGFELWNNIGMCFYRKNKLIAVISHFYTTTPFEHSIQ